jgi:hypothetical protein
MGAPAWVGWSQQLNLTYSPLTLTGANSGFTYQPEGFVYGNDSIINGTMALMVTDLDLFVTPFNTSMLNPHIIALGVSPRSFIIHGIFTNCSIDVYGWVNIARNARVRTKHPLIHEVG